MTSDQGVEPLGLFVVDNLHITTEVYFRWCSGNVIVHVNGDSIVGLGQITSRWIEEILKHLEDNAEFHDERAMSWGRVGAVLFQFTGQDRKCEDLISSSGGHLVILIAQSFAGSCQIGLYCVVRVLA